MVGSEHDCCRCAMAASQTMHRIAQDLAQARRERDEARALVRMAIDMPYAAAGVFASSYTGRCRADLVAAVARWDEEAKR